MFVSRIFKPFPCTENLEDLKVNKKKVNTPSCWFFSTVMLSHEIQENKVKRREGLTRVVLGLTRKNTEVKIIEKEKERETVCINVFLKDVFITLKMFM